MTCFTMEMVSARASAMPAAVMARSTGRAEGSGLGVRDDGDAGVGGEAGAQELVVVGKDEDRHRGDRGDSGGRAELRDQESVEPFVVVGGVDESRGEAEGEPVRQGEPDRRAPHDGEDVEVGGCARRSPSGPRAT